MRPKIVLSFGIYTSNNPLFKMKRQKFTLNVLKDLLIKMTYVLYLGDPI